MLFIVSHGQYVTITLITFKLNYLRGGVAFGGGTLGFLGGGTGADMMIDISK